MDLRSVLAKIYEIESPTKVEVPVNEGPLDFLKGLGAGEAKAIPKVKPKIEPKFDPAVTTATGQGAEQAVTTALADANKKLTLLRKVTPAEAAAAKAEGKTLDELLFSKYPETFAKFEKDPQLATSISKEFSKAADELMMSNAGGKPPAWLRPQEETHGKKSLAMSALIHALIVLGLLINKSSSTSKEKTASSTTSDTSTASQGASKIAPDEISWKTLGINPKAYEGASLEKSSLDGQWKVILPNGRIGGLVTDPEMIKKIEELAAMSPEARKASKPREVELWSADDIPKPAAAATAPAEQDAKDADIGITSKKKKEQEKTKKKKDEKILPASQW